MNRITSSWRWYWIKDAIKFAALAVLSIVLIMAAVIIVGALNYAHHEIAAVISALVFIFIGLAVVRYNL